MKDVPPYAIVVGNPFRILRYRFDESVIASLLQIAWWEWPPEVIASRAESFYAPIEEFVAMYLSQAGTPQTLAKPPSPLLPTVKAEFKLDTSTWKPTW